MPSPKVLVDLSLAHSRHGFSGIPQDSRLLFDGLARSTNIETEGLIWGTGPSWRGRPPTTLEDQAVFLGSYLGRGRRGWSLKVLNKLSPAVSQGVERLILNPRSRYKLHRLESDTFQDMVWRTLFSSTVEPARRQALLTHPYFITPLGLARVADGTFGRLSTVSLDTRGHDFIVFQDSRQIKVSAGTTKIIRYHDGIPVFSSDTTGSSDMTRVHIRGVKGCEDDSIFVCNSTSSQEDLARISPRAAANSRVIPYFIPRMATASSTQTNLANLALPRVSTSTLGKSDAAAVVSKWFESDGASAGPDYIMTLATIEPRKNQKGLIAAWQKYRNRTGRKTKLLIIGSPGWQFESILNEMKPFVSTGQLLHLERVSQEELRYWYSNALCFAFISYAEGFGMPPIEAMQCGCPVLVSDIAAHRYAAGDGATYCDPYDAEEIAAKLEFLLAPKNRAEVDALVARGHVNAGRFTVERILPLWEDLFSHPPAVMPA